MDERLQALLVGVGLLTSTFDGECSSIEPDTEHEYEHEDLNSNAEDLSEGEPLDSDIPQTDCIHTDSSCDDEVLHTDATDCSVQVDTDSIEEVHCTEYLNTEECTPPHECNIEEDKDIDVIIEDTYKEVECVNNSEVSNTELLSDKEKLVDLMLSYNINVDGRRKSSSGLFNFGYNSDNDELLDLDSELMFDDDDIVKETVQSPKKEKKGLLSKFRRR